MNTSLHSSTSPPHLSPISSTVCIGTHPLPWQLSPTAIKVIDDRVKKIVYPHNVASVANEQDSFFTDAGRVWKANDRLVAFLAVLPTVLRDYVPHVRAGISHLIVTPHLTFTPYLTLTPNIQVSAN